MNKSLIKIIVIVLMVAIGGLSGCKQTEIIDESSVIGSWEVKSWSSSDSQFIGCDMLGTLTFSRKDWGGIKVTFNFTYHGVFHTPIGYASLGDLPRITFDILPSSFGSFGTSMEFDGFVDDGKMMGRGGWGSWGSQTYNDWTWEAVKQ